MAGVPAAFPASIQWTFPTLWYVDGCTEQVGTIPMYAMGGLASYPLLGKVCMFHRKDVNGSVMSTFFDPALMDTELNRVIFLDESITYLLGGVGIAKNNIVSAFNVMPNPSIDNTAISFNLAQESDINYAVYTISGLLVKTEHLGKRSGENTIQLDLSTVNAGMFLVSLTVDNNTFYKKIIKE